MVRAWYLEEEWTLVLSLRTGWPEPVGKWAGFSRGNKVAEGQRLLEEIRNLFVRLHTVCTLALQQGRIKIYFNSGIISHAVLYVFGQTTQSDHLVLYSITHLTTYRGIVYMRRDINQSILSISQPPPTRNSVHVVSPYCHHLRGGNESQGSVLVTWLARCWWCLGPPTRSPGPAGQRSR